MKRLFLLPIFYIFLFGLSISSTFAQGLSDEEDEWETETLEALEPIWIQSRAKPVSSKEIKSTTTVNRPAVAVTGAALPVTPVKPAIKKPDAVKIVAESTAIPKKDPVMVRSKPFLFRQAKPNPAILSPSEVATLSLPHETAATEFQLPANNFDKNKAGLAAIEPLKEAIIAVKSQPFTLNKTISAVKGEFSNVSSPIVTPKQDLKKPIVLPENTSLAVGTVLASVDFMPLIEYIKPSPSVEKVEKVANLEKKPLKIASFTPTPASKPSLGINSLTDELEVSSSKREAQKELKIAAKPTLKIELPVEDKLVAVEPILTEATNAAPIKSGVATIQSSKLAAKTTVAAQKIMVSDLDGAARTAYMSAYDEFRISNYAQAEPFLKTTLRLEPLFADGYRMLVECYEKEGNYKQAILSYKKYLEFYPNNEKDWFNLSLLYSKVNDMDKSVEACLRATTINPNYEKGQRRLVNLLAATGRTDELAMQTSDEGIFKYALVLYKQKKMTEAMERLAMMQTTTAEAQYLLGVCLRKLNQDEKAIAAHKQAILLNANHVEAMIELGVLSYNQKKYAEAVTYFGQAYARKTSDTELSFFLGRALLFNKEPLRAISYLEKAVAASPKNTEVKQFLTYAYYEADKQRDETAQKAQAEAPAALTVSSDKKRNKWYNEGLEAIKIGDFDAAIPKFERAAQEDSREPRTFYMLGLAFYNLKNYAKAIDNFAKAVKLDAAYVKAYEGLGKSYYAQEEGDKAAENYELAIQKGGATASNCSELAAVYSLTNQPERAVVYFEKAVQLEPKNAQIHFNFGTMYLQQGALTKALGELQKSVDCNAQYWSAHYNIAQVYLKQDKLDEAMSLGEKLIKLNPNYANGYAICAIVCNKRGDSYNQEKYAKMAKKLDPSLPFD